MGYSKTREKAKKYQVKVTRKQRIPWKLTKAMLEEKEARQRAWEYWEFHEEEIYAIRNTDFSGDFGTID